ncbi:hypothetical protein PPGU19_025330 [Paraburkholderia sp. PGU19]|uniref:hypothetical protein n=1 Tax=Paraburkholderia sp. PGU19 TaxID=2735434 RepID=UPI0015DAAA6D|nr:hypothetical protein [Paraburkholderia sp. PGU19]BCF97964.1 hypothetical protein PPGU19_025330 [Paraburkholderia sp. PGU19]
MDQTKQRAEYIRKVRSAQLLDAVFLFFYYNKWKRNWGPRSERPPTLELSDVLPELSQPAYEHALTLVARMWKGAEAVGLAFFRYPEAKRTYEEERIAFKLENPGFSEESYELAIHAAFITFR